MDDADLVGYIFDTLEPEEQEKIEEQVARDPELAARVEQLRKLARPLADDDVIEPPPDLAKRTFDYALHVPARAHASGDWAAPVSRARPLDFAVAAAVMIAAATLVFPTVLMLRGDQSRVLCANQLRNLGIALAQYSAIENGPLPFVAADGPMNHAGVFAMSLKARDLLPDVKSLICPSADSGVVMVPEVDEYLKKIDPTQKARARQYMAGSYGYVLGYEQDGAHHGFDQVGQLRPVASDRPPRPGESESGNSPNHHQAGQNVLYADGSVRWLTAPRSGSDEIFRNEFRRVAAGVGPEDIVIGVSESVPYPDTGL